MMLWSLRIGARKVLDQAFLWLNIAIMKLPTSPFLVYFSWGYNVMMWWYRGLIHHCVVIGESYVSFNPPPIGWIPNMYPSCMLYIYGSGRVIDRVLVWWDCVSLSWMFPSFLMRGLLLLCATLGWGGQLFESSSDGMDLHPVCL